MLLREDTVDQAPDEQSPLLGAPAKTINEPESTPIAQELPLPKLIAVLLSVWIGVFLASLDGTVISTLLAPISSDFESFSSLSWITTAYLIAQASLQPLFGKLTDIYGRREGLLVSNGLFTVGTALCGLAPNQYVMIVGRILAGAGGGGMTAISSIVATDLVPLRKRGIVQGGGNIAFGSGAALGGLFGGIVNDTIGWRWAFMIQIPLVVISSILVLLFVNIPIKRTSEARHKRVDYLGSLTLVLFLLLFLLALNTGGSLVPWTHPLVLTSLPLSALFLAAFIYTETHFAKEPIIPLTSFKDRTVIGACLTFLFMVMSMFSAYFFLPIYSMLRGASSTSAGLQLMPFSIGISIGSLSAGLIMNKTGRYYYLGVASMGMFNLGTGLFTTFSLTLPTWPQYLYLLFFGTGYGATLTVGLLALIAAVTHEEQATTTSTSYLFRATGGTIGAAVGSAVFQTALRRKLLSTLGSSKEAREIAQKVLKDFGEVAKVPEPWRAGVVVAYMHALRLVFVAAFVIGILGLGSMLIMKEHVLHKRLDRK
ncbi:major facilitator superfamily domain-containing protein [Sphaerosporella brunnea]|uniref:Major facilitator superfamily domain-containing protein n=1 Tax=Sphaerosporella brunnea TaxID=1250544 RepID=A0A5J5ECE0_9PEZI|nr:major facilitator superfamily domain-containing protein [Sphaerosporella brunnea]